MDNISSIWHGPKIKVKWGIWEPTSYVTFITVTCFVKRVWCRYDHNHKLWTNYLPHGIVHTIYKKNEVGKTLLIPQQCVRKMDDLWLPYIVCHQSHLVCSPFTDLFALWNCTIHCNVDFQTLTKGFFSQMVVYPSGAWFQQSRFLVCSLINRQTDR